jgi:hypothetical protein
MVDQAFVEKVRKLPVKQQIALWVILKYFHKSSSTSFKTSEFAEKAKFFIGSSDPKTNARTMGGIVSSLVRNGVIEQLSGGREPVWQLVKELHENAKDYENVFSPIVTYWEESNPMTDSGT